MSSPSRDPAPGRFAIVTAVLVRAAAERDAEAVARVFSASRRALPFLPRLHTLEADAAFICDVVMPSQAVLVTERLGKIDGFAAVDGDTVAHLYVLPDEAGRGIGSRLLAHLMTATALGERRRLRCFAANAGARRFYERHGFIAGDVTDGSHNEEGLPDVLYVWRAP